MSIRNMILASGLLIGLQGCGMIEDLTAMQQKMLAITDDLQKELGLVAQVGWNIENGTLTQVRVYIRDAAVEEKTLGQLRDEIVPVLEPHFKQTPQMWLITAAFEGS